MQRRQLLLLGVASFAVNGVQAASDPLVVIVGPATNIDGLEFGVLQRMFRGEAVNYAGSRRAVPFNHPVQTSERREFDRVVLGLSPDEVARYWINRKIRGQSGPPRTVPSSALLLRVVAQLKGAIGYVRSSQLNGSVRPLRIDGKAHTDRDYRLG
ncbi:MAG: hypothetical protein SFV15_07360 [Polyangiaceae bacterium]|nr:hypothetical protein [Polyangiaceae bacterium]